MVRKMSKKTMETTVKKISHEKRKKNIIMVTMVDLIMVIQSTHIVRRMSRPKRKHSSKDRSQCARRGKIEK